MTQKTEFALLDPDGVLVGFQKRKPGRKTRFVEVPKGCDLAPGRYRWNEGDGRFDPLAPLKGDDAARTAPDALEALASLIEAWPAATQQPAPPKAEVWLEHWRASVDGAKR